MLVVHTYISHAISFVSLKMSDSGTASPAKKGGKGKKKAEKKPSVSVHPTYAAMVSAAIVTVKGRSGCSRQAIVKYVKANYQVNEGADNHIKTAIRRGVSGGTFKQVKGTGASGSFKLAEKPKRETKKPAKKAPASKKPVKKTASKKKTNVKKTPVKKAKKPAAKKGKKPIAKKAAAKKPTAKKASKPKAKTSAKKSK